MENSGKIKTKVFFVRFMGKAVSRLGHKNFIMLCALLVGAVSGFAAIALKKFAGSIYQVTNHLNTHNEYNLLLWGLPLIGIISALIAQRIIFQKNEYTKSLSSLIYILERNLPNIPFRKTFSHLVTSGLSIGMGGSAGLEAPIVITGAAIGSNSANMLGFSRKDKTLLLACGAAAGISAIFNSPVAGVLFVAEVLLTEFSVSSLIPILIASASAAVVSRLFYQGQIFLLVSKEWVFHALPFYVLLGIISALVGIYMIKSTYILSDILNKYFKNICCKAILGGSLLSLLIVLFPPLFGEGYSSVNMLFDGNYAAIIKNSPLADIFSGGMYPMLIFCIFIILIKVIATSLTIECGGDGGIFASAIFSGAFTGFVFATGVNMTGLVTLNTPNFIAAGMCGVFTAVLRAPMTGIFLIAEITGGYLLFIPLMIVAAIAFFTAKYFEPYSVYTKGLAAKNLFFHEDKDSLILSRISINSLIENNFTVLKNSDSFHKILEAITASARNIFPVVDSEGRLEGLVHVDNIRKYLLETELHDVLLVYDVMDVPAGELMQDDNLSKAMTNFEVFNTWHLPVLSAESKKYIGFISKSNVLSHYRDLVKDIS